MRRPRHRASRQRVGERVGHSDGPAEPVGLARWWRAAAERDGDPQDVAEVTQGQRVGLGQQPGSLPAQGQDQDPGADPDRLGHRHRRALRHREPDRRRDPTRRPKTARRSTTRSTWMDNPDAKSLAAYKSFSCGPDQRSANVDPDTGKLVEGDDPALPLVTCDDQGRSSCCRPRWSRAPTSRTPAPASPRTTSTGWSRSTFNGDGTRRVRRRSPRPSYGTQKLFAIVLDGKVHLRTHHERHHHRTARPRSAATSTRSPPRAWPPACKLRRAADHVRQEPHRRDRSARPWPATSSPPGCSRACSALLLVMIYCLFYYRGLGVVVVASLLVAAGITYGMVLLLGTRRRLHPDPARHRRPDRGGRHHRRLVHRLLRTNTRRDARRQVDAGRGRGRLEARPEHLPRGRRGLDPRGRRALHLRGRRGEGLRVRARPLAR